jgi:hypothetical protein
VPVAEAEEVRVAANVLWRTIALVAVTAAAAAIMGAGQPQALPEYPNVFSGSVTIAGEPAPDGVEIFARVGSSYQSNVARPGFEAHERPIVLTEGGRYENLKVQPTGTNNIGRSITFFATYGNGEVQAAETLNFQPGPFFENNHDLTFAALPPGAAEPTPVSTTEATTPTPAEPTPPPSPSPTPVLPIPGDPNIPRISQLVLVLGAAAIIAGGAMLMLIRRRKVL